ncbi:MAG: 50S ribosomal protein L15 [Candidatus Poribacteria bacterium]|jgi:large subunit ribosomal protein L15|nr:50S ribosomal protein L15 [Candidatus Poribacteria bacterium]MDP6961224.1 50S ribosomal protein L15 [Dehalococcoidia bacterium]|tara:strand:- start:472 stop:918 length:447 start_codon:yes stop_codon:yes gene_type:complete
MKLNQLQPFSGARRSKKRIGRGDASGTGGTAGRGHKGQKSRSGGSIPAWFEGGQMPLVRRIPKRGPKRTAHKRIEYDIVNLGTLNQFDDGEDITLNRLVSASLVSPRNPKVKILGEGTLEKQLTIHAHRFSKSAIQEIESKGGKIKVI